MRTVPLQKYVYTHNIRCSSLHEFIDLLHKKGNKADFVDGTAFAPNHIVCVLGYKTNFRKKKRFDNFVNHKIYWKSLRDTTTTSTHFMPLMEYIYRWETDLYYTSANPKVPSVFKIELLRRAIPRKAVPWVKQLAAWVNPVNIDNVCADIMIPVSRACDFYSFYCSKVGLFPLYLCPARSRNPGRGATFWTGEPLLDFGVAYGVLPGSKEEQLRYRTLMEREMLRLGGRKLPYSRQGLMEDEFWATRGGAESRKQYQDLRENYFATGRFPDVYTKLK